MAHLIRAIALANTNDSSNGTSSTASKPSPGTNPFNTDVFAEVPIPRRLFLRGLFSGDHSKAPHDVENRALQHDSAHGPNSSESRARSLELQFIGKKQNGTSDVVHRDEIGIDDTILSDDIHQGSENSNSIQHVRIPEPVASPPR